MSFRPTAAPSHHEAYGSRTSRFTEQQILISFAVTTVFLSKFRFEETLQKWNISSLTKAFFGNGCAHNWATSNKPTALSGIGKSVGPTLGDAQLTEGTKPSCGLFPLFPNAISQSTSHPRIQFFQLLIASGVFEIIHPTDHELIEILDSFGKGNGSCFAGDDFDFLF